MRSLVNTLFKVQFVLITGNSASIVAQSLESRWRGRLIIMIAFAIDATRDTDSVILVLILVLMTNLRVTDFAVESCLHWSKRGMRWSGKMGAFLLTIIGYQWNIAFTDSHCFASRERPVGNCCVSQRSSRFERNSGDFGQISDSFVSHQDMRSIQSNFCPPRESRVIGKRRNNDVSRTNGRDYCVMFFERSRSLC